MGVADSFTGARKRRGPTLVIARVRQLARAGARSAGGRLGMCSWRHWPHPTLWPLTPRCAGAVEARRDGRSQRRADDATAVGYAASVDAHRDVARAARADDAADVGLQRAVEARRDVAPTARADDAVGGASAQLPRIAEPGRRAPRKSSDPYRAASRGDSSDPRSQPRRVHSIRPTCRSQLQARWCMLSLSSRRRRPQSMRLWRSPVLTRSRRRTCVRACRVENSSACFRLRAAGSGAATRMRFNHS